MGGEAVAGLSEETYALGLGEIVEGWSARKSLDAERRVEVNGEGLNEQSAMCVYYARGFLHWEVDAGSIVHGARMAITVCMMLQ